jgi:hypothetical protein
MQKMFIVHGFDEDNKTLDEINRLLAAGWEVEKMTAAPVDGNVPCCFVVLELKR